MSFGQGQETMRLLRRGFTFLGLLISVSIIILSAVIVIPQLLSLNMAANQSAARVALKAISTALETYAAEGNQGYPTDISILIIGNPPYLNQNYVEDSPVQGYDYACESLEVSGYSCSARPQHCGWTGSKIYTITTGGALTEVDCRP